ncbi:fumarylacetoacetate hydrolase family protein [Halocatena halophila]|uniref:fumarylacetoacetate hydrolase family protein n=1 Tax=Halocatena halophila TaxID=2814576 RepID=UPI002ED5B2F9
MQVVRYTRGTVPAWGIKTGDTIHALAGIEEGDPTLSDWTNPSFRDRIARAVTEGTLSQVSVDSVSLLAPIDEPGTIICAGLNYRDHAEEQDKELPERPMLFSKANSAVTNPNDPIVHPGGDEQVDYEVELAVVMGRRASAIEPDAVYDHVAGYTVLNDVSGRTSQFEDGQFFRGKSYDTFAPLGPTLAVDDIDPNALDVELRVNGTVKQSSNTEQFVFDVGELVSYISQSITLHPGDIISTGTPGGVGIFREPVDCLEPGDSCAATIEAIGTLNNPVIGE